jgi:hypothetical protein
MNNFIILNNTQGFYALHKSVRPYLVLIFKVHNFYINIFQIQLSSCSFQYTIGLKTKDYIYLEFCQKMWPQTVDVTQAISEFLKLL